MFKDIARYVRSCENCIAHKTSQQRPAGKLRATHVSAPWQQVAIDLVGLLPRSTQGNAWLLTMQDRFSKWVEMVPLRRATAVGVTREFTRRVIYRHECPDLVISDNGTQLTSRQIENAFRSFGVKHQTSPAYIPQCNPVERANRTLKTMISQYVGKKHRRWDKYIPQLQFAYNTARQAATGYIPAFLVHGRELRFPHPKD
ncbi:hypothetical protein ACFW04_013058 [Cataglyphis niger]